MRQIKLFKNEHSFKIGDIVKLKNPILKSDIGKKYIITDFMDGFEDEIVFCRLLNNNLKEIINISSIIDDLEKI